MAPSWAIDVHTALTMPNLRDAHSYDQIGAKINMSSHTYLKGVIVFFSV